MPIQDVHENFERELNEKYLRAAIASVESVSSLPSVTELARALEHLPVAVFIDSSPGECIYANSAYLQLCEIGDKAIGPDSWPMVADSDLRTEFDSLRDRLWNEAKPFSVTAAVITSFGTTKWLWTNSIPIVDTAGKVVRIVGTVVDVTERVEAMNALEQSEKQLRALVTNTADAIIGIDSQQHIQVWNETSTQMFGYEQEEILGESISILLPAETNTDHSELVRNFVEGEDSRISMMGRSVRAKRKDGSEFDVEIGIVKVRLGDTELYVATVRDVTIREQILAERQKSDTRFRALIQNSLDSIFVVGADDIISYASPAIEKITGYRADETIGLFLRDVISQIHREDRARVQKVADDVRSRPRGQGIITYRQRHFEGEYRTLEARITNYLDMDGLNGLVINIRDISQTIAMEAEIKRRNEELTAVFSAFPDQLYRVSSDGVIVESLVDNGKGQVDAARLVGRRLTDVIPGDVGNKVSQAFKRVASAHGRETLEYSAEDLGLRGDGTFEARLSALPDGNVLASVRNISAQARLEKQLSFQALHDALTGLPNRLYLANELQLAIEETAARSSLVGVLFLDLDGFKRINDGLGHAAGDELLVAVAKLLKSAVRPTDIVARIGGDEFIIMSDDFQNQAEATRVAERVRVALDRPIHISDTEVTISASIGIAIANAEGCDAEKLLAHADAAMYRAKARGRARAEVFDEEMQNLLDRRVVLEAKLRNALDQGDVTVRFQAIVDGATGKISGVQALPHWSQTLHGMVDPVNIMEIAEEAALGYRVDDVVMNQALEETTRCQLPEGKFPLLSLSLSGLHAADSKFRHRLMSKLETSGLEPESLCLEVSEAALLGASDKVLTDLRALRDLGMRLAVDDFGAGHSSLGSLRSFPITSLKIESSFIAGLVNGRADAAIVRSTIDLAHKFGYKVVAKGVDTPEQMALLRSMGCDGMQGAFIAEPLSPKGFAKLLAKDNRW